MATFSVEPTVQLRWVSISMMQAHRDKLQQGWLITVKDDDGKVTEARIEWRDIPVEKSP